LRQIEDIHDTDIQNSPSWRIIARTPDVPSARL
jgi:hypothetical protein